MKNQKTALVLGANGGIGGEVARRLLKQGWQVQALSRHLNSKTDNPSIKWYQGDAMNQDDVLKAADGVQLIVHAVNPPGYKNWAQLVMPMLENTITAARKTKARILLPGTIYNYGTETDSLLTEKTLQQPSTRKGAIRLEMETRLKKAANEGVKTVIVRAGDFFGPQTGNNWFAQGLVKPNQILKSITYPGREGVGHSWAFLPDLAQTMVEIVEQESRLQNFETFHFKGHWDKNGKEMIEAIQQSVGTSVKVTSLPWFILKVLSPFVVLFKEMTEMKYLWDQPFELSNNRIVSFLGAEPHTNLDEAVTLTLKGLGVRAQ